MKNISTYHSLEEMPLVLRVDDLRGLLSISRSAAYRLVQSGQIRSVRVGVAIRIPRVALIEFLNGSTT